MKKFKQFITENESSLDLAAAHFRAKELLYDDEDNLENHKNVENTYKKLSNHLQTLTHTGNYTGSSAYTEANERLTMMMSDAKRHKLTNIDHHLEKARKIYDLGYIGNTKEADQHLKELVNDTKHYDNHDNPRYVIFAQHIRSAAINRGLNNEKV